ncbi:MAG TPA: hypothetical protein VGF28_12220 [Thermoanaerobaculia bacterium]
MKTAVRFFAAACAVLLLACQGESVTPPEVAAALQPYPGSKVLKSGERGAASHVAYEVAVPYPAEPVLEFIRGRLPPRFRPRNEDFMNPGVPTSHVRGWTDYADHSRKPHSWVHHWAGEWEDSGGNILSYDLMYRSPGAESGGQPTSRQLQVMGNYFPREQVDAIKESLPAEQEPEKRESATRPAAPSAPVANPGYLVLRPHPEGDVIIDLSDVALQEVEIAGGDGETAVVLINLNAAGAKKLTAWTSANVGKQIGVYLDGKLISTPRVVSPLDSFVIDNELSKDEARKILARIRRGGAP